MPDRESLYNPSECDHWRGRLWLSTVTGGQGLAKIPQIGTVEIGDGVEIGAGSCVDQGKFSATTIGDGTKIDNLVQIAHNCKLGRCCVMAGQSGLAGSVTLGDGVMMGGGARVKLM